MKTGAKKSVRCAIYTRVSTDQGLEQDFNSLDAQREAAEAYIKSQAHEGWRLCPERYDDGGLSGGSLERPALQALLAAVAHGRVDVIIVYKVDGEWSCPARVCSCAYGGSNHRNRSRRSSRSPPAW